jgi:SAM-dependent methyltransferase
MKRCLQCASRFAGDDWTCANCGFAPVYDGAIPIFAADLARDVSGYQTTLFDTHGGDEAERSFWTAARASLIVWALREYAPGARRFLEIGCGTGGVLTRIETAFPSMECTGAEALVAGLHKASGRLTRTQLMQFDATRIPFDQEFDAVGAFDVIEHIADDDAVLRSMAESLRPGGIMVLSVPQHPWLFGPADVSARHERRYTRAGLISQVARTGLQIVTATSFVSVLFPAMAGVRLIAKWRGGDYDSADEFAIGPLNGLFGSIMDFERWSIRHGVRWPAGGSLLLVARKKDS